MTVIRSIATIALVTTVLAFTVPAAADIVTFANYSGVGGANMYWNRAGTKYIPATTATVIASHVVPVPTYLGARPGHPLTAAQTTNNALLLKNYNIAVAKQIPLQQRKRHISEHDCWR